MILYCAKYLSQISSEIFPNLKRFLPKQVDKIPYYQKLLKTTGRILINNKYFTTNFLEEIMPLE